MKLKIRKAEYKDITDLQIISKKVIQNNYVSFLGQESVDEFINSGMSDNYISGNIDKAFIIQDDNIIVGMAIIINNLIDLLMIDVNYQRKGIGSYFLNEISNKLFTKYDILKLESFKDNYKTNNFYHKNNWKQEKIAVEESTGITKIYYYKTKQ